jgi:hypothetical protein
MKENARRLILTRETIHRLDEPMLRRSATVEPCPTPSRDTTSIV